MKIEKHFYNFSNFFVHKIYVHNLKKFVLLTLFIFVEEVVKREVYR